MFSAPRSRAPLRVRFGAPRSNWLLFAVATPSVAFDEPLSGSLGDALLDLASAAREAADGRESRCLVGGDLQSFEVRFRPVSQGVRVKVLTRLGAGSDALPALPALVARGPTDEVLLPFWQALRQLGDRWPAGPACWRHPFPEAEVHALGARLGVV